MSIVESLNSYLEVFFEVIEAEVSNLIGDSFRLTEKKTTSLTGEDFSGQSMNILAYSQLIVSGDYSGQVYILLTQSEPGFLKEENLLENDGNGPINQDHQQKNLDSQNLIPVLNALNQSFQKQIEKIVSTSISVNFEEPKLLSNSNHYPFLAEDLKGKMYIFSCQVHLGVNLVGMLHVLLPDKIMSVSKIEETGSSGSEEDNEQLVSKNLSPQELRDILLSDQKKTEDTNEQRENNQDDEKISEVETESEVDLNLIHQTITQSARISEEELGNLLGQGFEFTEAKTTVVSRKDLFDQYKKKVILTKILVSGEERGEMYSLVSIQDAIFLGGSLLMVPEKEIDKNIKENNFSEDEADAFGEIMNILTGAFSNVFIDSSFKKLHLRKDRMEIIDPNKIDTKSADPIPDGKYYLVSYTMQLGNRSLGELKMVFPLIILGISDQQAKYLEKASNATYVEENPAVAIISENHKENKVISTTLEALGCDIFYLSFKENIKEKLRFYNIRAVFLVVNEVDEKNLAKLIKVKSLLRGKHPIIISAPNWTRTKVLKAVKYGACDIINTPADPNDLKEKCEQQILANSQM